MVRCELSAVEINDLVESPFRRDEKLPSATERYLAIQDHTKTESFIILGIKQRSVAVRNGPHNMVRCDLSGVENKDLVDSPFRRDEKMPSATERCNSCMF